jgi:hypothetical protein
MSARLGVRGGASAEEVAALVTALTARDVASGAPATTYERWRSARQRIVMPINLFVSVAQPAADRRE